jgi:hypothetical protein
MPNIQKPTEAKSEAIQKYVLEHPDKTHPDFDVILDALIKLEQTNRNILAQAENYPELNNLIMSVSDTLNQAQSGLADAAILREDISSERDTSRNNE